MSLERYSHDTERNNTKVACECGSRKSPGRDACERCTFLDGTRANAQIIDLLRGTDGLSAAEVSRELGNAHDEGVARSLRRLLGLGRVRRYWREPDTNEVEYTCFGIKRRMVRVCGNGCWVYVLDAKMAEHVQSVSTPRKQTDEIKAACLRKRNLRAKRHAEGKCIECEGVPVMGLKICEECREAAHARYAARKQRAA